MGSPELTTTSRNTAASGRSSVIDSIWGCTGSTIDKEDLRKRITMPEYLRVAMREAIQNKDVDSVKRHFDMAYAAGAEVPRPSESPIVVFINAKSGGRHGPELKARLQDLMGEEQVFDLSAVKPSEFVQFGLSCLEKFAALGDTCAKETREKIRVVAAGGDGTVGWVLGCLGELKKQDRDPVPPTGIIPLGTGNDLSRSFGWGGSFPFNWKTATKRILDRVANGPICHLDSWNLVISMPAGEVMETPYSLKPSDCASLDQDLEIDGELPEKSSYYQGVFYNYFSIGMDAQVAYGFHHLRNEKPYLAQGPLSNKFPPIEAKLKTFWPELKANQPKWSLWKHEWQKHGVCIGEHKSKEYFNSAISINDMFGLGNLYNYLKTSGITPSDSKTYTKEDIIKAVQKVFSSGPAAFNIYLRCAAIDKQKAYLNEVVLCTTLDGSSFITCPIRATNCDGFTKIVLPTPKPVTLPLSLPLPTPKSQEETYGTCPVFA